MIYLLAVLYLTAGYWCYTKSGDARVRHPEAIWEFVVMLFWPFILLLGIVMILKEDRERKKR